MKQKVDMETITTEKERKKLAHEIDMLKNLKHPRILKIHDFWSNPRSNQVLNLASVKKWCRQILGALDYLHTLKPWPVIHRDIKCDNIFIDGPTGNVTIGDLGLSTTVGHVSSAATGRRSGHRRKRKKHVRGEKQPRLEGDNSARNDREKKEEKNDDNDDDDDDDDDDNDDDDDDDDDADDDDDDNEEDEDNGSDSNHLHTKSSKNKDTITERSRKILSIVGTAEFMAPELYSERYDEKVDIYAFGMCVVEMITRKYPYA
ncbi:hypothetical protein RFI_17992, partial [Reticulomyxa filosa]